MLDEILQTVFELVREAAHHDTKLKQPGNLQWLSVALVCRRWRHVALSTKSLWSHIKTGNDARFSTFLQRANGGPVDLVFLRDRIHSDTTAYAEAIASSRSKLNIRSIRWGNPRRQSLVADILAALSKEIPPMERLTFHWLQEDTFQILADCSLPILSSLTFTFAPFPIHELSLPSLTELVIETQYICVHMFLRSLSHMPLLETIQVVLSECIPYSGPQSRPRGPTPFVTLNHLRRFNINHEMDFVVYTLAHLTFPADTDVTARFSVMNNAPLLGSGILSSLIGAHPLFGRIINLRAADCAPNYVDLETNTAPQEGSRHRLHLSCVPVDHLSTVCAELARLSAPQEIENLQIHVELQSLPVNGWHGLFRGLPSIQRIEMSSCKHADAFFEAMITPDALVDGQLIPCQRLEELLINGLRLEAHECNVCWKCAVCRRGAHAEREEFEYCTCYDEWPRRREAPDYWAALMREWLMCRTEEGTPAIRLEIQQERCPAKCDELGFWDRTAINSEAKELVINGKTLKPCRWNIEGKGVILS